eukprot:TRINITY_DN12437_c0_g1_i2.p1 TRINITY_DN12437_c0_g1~~TRINITY_DN12437_c0_g1_i2.p1  ORF type:complete len:804 (+),score=341.99 TRINITY_DN12437_c0_g1_i2:55-2466(+)
MPPKKDDKAAKWAEGMDCSVKVFLRVRPFNNKERKEMGVKEEDGVASVCTAEAALVGNSSVKVKGPTCCTIDKKDEKGGKAEGNSMFHFDKIFNSVAPGEGTQEEIFQTIGPDLLDASLCGYNICLMAYGQTSSGKTFTMTGGDSFGSATKRGVIPRFLDGLFSRMQGKESAENNVHFKLEAGYMEIYNEQVKDLLNPGRAKKLQVREHPDTGPFADGLTLKPILNPKAINTLLETGNKARHVRATKMNDVSSRSHAILQLQLTQYITMQGEDDDEPTTSTVMSKMNLVDLAGSERQKSTQSEGAGMKEAIHINTALHCLRKVIDALTAKKKPSAGGALRSLQRESILTWLLADSLGGNSKTVLIATASPADVNYSETLSTLKYASAARAIENVVKINTDGQTAVIKALEEEITKLQRQLELADRSAKETQIQSYVEEQEKLLQQLEASETMHEEERQQMMRCLESLKEERQQMMRCLESLKEERVVLEGTLTDEKAEHAKLKKQLLSAQAQLKGAVSDQAANVRHQNQLTNEIIHLRSECEGKATQLLQMERTYSRNLERMVKGDKKWEKLLKEATKPVKHKGNGDAGDPFLVEFYFTRLQNEALVETMDTLNQALRDAYTENARLVTTVNSSMGRIVDLQNQLMNDQEKDATIRRQQVDLETANAKEEKYLGQLRDLSLQHLMLKQKCEILESRGTNGNGAKAPAPRVQTKVIRRLPEELEEACEFFGFDDPKLFSQWVVKTLGYEPSADRKPRKPDLSGYSDDDEDVQATNPTLATDGALSLRSTGYISPERMKELMKKK